MIILFSSADCKTFYYDADFLRFVNAHKVSCPKDLFALHSACESDEFKKDLNLLTNGGLPDFKRKLLFQTNDGEEIELVFIFSLKCLEKETLIVGEAQYCNSTKDDEHFYKLQLSEMKMATIIDSAVDAIITIDETGAIQAFNRAAEKMFAYSVKEVMGRNISLLMPEPFRSEHSDYIARYLRTGIPHIIGIGREVVAQRKCGEIFPIDLAVGEVKSEEGCLFTGFVRDLTERKKLERERDSFFQMSMDLFCIIGFDGYLKKVNAQWEELLGYSFKELKEIEISKLFHPDDVFPDRPVFKGMLGGSSVVGKPVRMLCKNGDYRWLVWNGTVDINNQVIYGVARDVTEQKKMVQEIKDAKISAERSSEAKGLFIAKMSHELRTPLNSIIGFSNVLLKSTRKRLLPKEMVYLERIKQNGQSLFRLISSILDFSKTESGFIELDIQEVNVKEMIEEIVDLMQSILEEKNITIEISSPENLELLNSDPIKLRQIFQNLIDNAVKFSEKGIVKICILAEVIDGLNIIDRVQIIDSGPGISVDELNIIFEAFQQGDNGFARKFGGAGLGLSIAKSFSELLDLQIVVERTGPEGSCFSVIFARENGEKSD